MPGRRMLSAAFGLTSLLVLSQGQTARAQAIAFQPVISEFPNGVNLNTTPVVSADRRYVRIGVTAQFTNIEGFSNFSVPNAVSGGGGRGFGGGGLGGGGGGGGRVAAGMRGNPDRLKPRRLWRGSATCPPDLC
jgi:hypothetical protein